MPRRYQDSASQRLFEDMLALARDKNSELYHDGKPRRGAGHRAAFWDGASGKFDTKGPRRSAHAIPGTMSMICFMAGREFARQLEREKAAQSKKHSTKASVGRPTVIGGKRVQVYLDDVSLQTAATLGAGNVSEGIRKALKCATQEPPAENA